MSSMTHPGVICYLAMAGWAFVVLLAFLQMRPPQAVLFALVTGTLFLPVVSIKLPHATVLTRERLTSFVPFLFLLCFAPELFKKFKFKFVDTAMIVWTLSPLFSSLSNDLGFRDGAYASVSSFFTWGAPYFLGRLCFDRRSRVALFLKGIFLGGLVYIPFCLYEVRMSPQLHRIVYGYTQHEFLQTIRYGGYRPMVFMDHGLMLGLWMTMATVAGFWFYRNYLIKSKNAKLWFVAWSALLVTTFLCKSTGALFLLVAAMAFVFVKSPRLRSVFFLLLFFIPLGYVVARATGAWSGSQLVDLVGATLGWERAQSIAYRLYNESLLIGHALERPILGWAGWGRGFSFTDFQNSLVAVTDSLWIIVLSSNGVWGLFWLYLTLTLPIWLTIRYSHLTGKRIQLTGPAGAMTLLIMLYVFDTAFNNFPNPVYIALIGSASGLLSGPIWEEAEEQSLEAASLAYTPSEPLTPIRGNTRESQIAPKRWEI